MIRVKSAGAVALAMLFGAVSAPPAGAEQPPPDLELQLVESGLDNPVALASAGDGSGRLFVVEQPGVIRLVGGGVFLDIVDQVKSTGNEQGLLGLAFHPDHANNGFFYVNYTYDQPGDDLDWTRVSRFELQQGDPDAADPESEEIILTFAQDFSNHNGGDLQFGPDGYLYISSGDGGSGFDPRNRGQTLDTLMGKILRIDVDGGDPYAIPPDNPFTDRAAALDEIWAYGLRNPWRMSFDRTTGDLYIGDVGQLEREEINRQPAVSAGGENYGWACMEGDLVQNFQECDDSPLTAPILVYDHGSGCAVTGGYVYRGTIGGLFGRYVFADYCAGDVFFASPGPNGWVAEEFATINFALSSFGEGEDGELYLTDRDDGLVYRIASPSSILSDYFEDGDTGRWSAVVAGD
jgi:glucose/arabinose dehydrogenase